MVLYQAEPMNLKYLEEILSFALERPPVLLDSGAVRMFHAGASSEKSKNRYNNNKILKNTLQV